MSDRPELTTMHVAPILAQASDRWRLTDPYVERVWVEVVGPTATLLAHRLGFLIDECPDGTEIEFADLATGIGVASGRCAHGVDRLHRYVLVAFQPAHRLIGVSGYAPPVSGRRLAKLSSVTRELHQRLSEEAALGVSSAAGSAGVCAAASRLSSCPAARAEGAGAVRGRVRAARVSSGRAASPDRVSSEVGSGRSGARVVGGPTPLQVALCATCGAACGRSRANGPAGPNAAGPVASRASAGAGSCV